MESKTTQRSILLKTQIHNWEEVMDLIQCHKDRKTIEKTETCLIGPILSALQGHDNTNNGFQRR